MHKKSPIFFLTIIILLNLVLVSCTFTSRSEQFNEDVADAVIQTMEARFQETQQAQQRSDELIAAVVSQVLTALPAPDDQEITVETEAQPTKQPACLAAVVTGENYPDGTVFSPGAAFTKRWTLKNTGTCTWTTSYTLGFMSGDRMGGPTSINFPHNVPPGGSVELLVPMVAPTNNGTFRGDWGLYSSSNVYIGKMWVSIKVTGGTSSEPTPKPSTPFKVTDVSYSISNDTTFYLPCVGGMGSSNITIGASITTNDKGTVKFAWIWNGANVGEVTDVFSNASTKIYLKDFAVTALDSGPIYHTISVTTIEPNLKDFRTIDFYVACE